MTGILQDVLPVFMGVLHKLLDVLLLSVLLGRDHVANAFVDHQFLLVFEVLAIDGYVVDQVEDVGLHVVFVLLGEHVFG